MKKKFFSNLVASTCLVTTAILSESALATPIILYKNANNIENNLASRSLPSAINIVIKNILDKDPSLYKIVVYKFDDHAILYLLSNQYWQIQKIRIDLDSAGNVKNTIDSYHENKSELNMLVKNTESACPDPSVQFVAISAYPEVGSVTQSIESVYAAASKRYKSVKILGDDVARSDTYKNWLSCTNLRGFYSIGHGDETEIMVGNGELIDFNFFASKNLINNFRYTTVALNSCLVFNNPLGTQLSFGNVFTKTAFINNPGPHAYEYLGGYMSLLIGASEETSACFMVNAIHGYKMDYKNIKKCVGAKDFYYRDFGLSKPGKYLMS